METRLSASIGQHDAAVFNVLVDQFDFFHMKADKLIRESYDQLRRSAKRRPDFVDATLKEARLLYYVKLYGDDGVNSLAERSGFARADTSKNLSILEARKCLRKEQHSKNYMQKVLTLTPGGEKVIARYKRALHSAMSELVRTLPDSRMEKHGFVNCVKSFNNKIIFERAGNIDATGSPMTENMSEEYAKKHGIDLSSEALAKLPWYAAPIYPEPSLPPAGIMPR